MSNNQVEQLKALFEASHELVREAGLSDYVDTLNEAIYSYLAHLTDHLSEEEVNEDNPHTLTQSGLNDIYMLLKISSHLAGIYSATVKIKNNNPFRES